MRSALVYPSSGKMTFERLVRRIVCPSIVSTDGTRSFAATPSPVGPALVAAAPDVADRHELPVAVDAEEQRAERVRAAALTLGPSADDALHRLEGLDPHPRRGARRRIRSV